jgi:hypothetical protein
VKRRKWLLVALRAVVVLLALAAVYVARVPVGHRFLRGAELKGYAIVDASPGVESAQSYYLLSQGAHATIAAAKKELSPADGWSVFFEETWKGSRTIGFQGSGGRRVVIIGAARESRVTLSHTPSALARLRLWLRKRRTLSPRP